MSQKPKVPSKEEQQEQGWIATYSAEQFAYCCGGIEVGGLDCYQRHKWNFYSWKGYWEEDTTLSKTPTEAWTKVLARVRDDHEHFPLMFNLVVGSNTELRDILSKEADATMVHTWRNPNTDNVIEMWILTNGSDLEYHGSDNDDD